MVAVKRRLLIVAVFLLAGAVVNVMVAWGCAVTINVHGVESEGARVFDEMMFGVDRWSRPGAVLVTCYRVRREARVYRKRGKADELLYDWTGFKVPTPEFKSGDRPSEKRAANGQGWPMLALWCETAFFKNGEVRGGIETGLPPFNTGLSSEPAPSVSPARFPLATRLVTEPRVLPLRPIWPGFAINTLFYAVVLWLLIPGPFALRRLIRIRRGLCPACAYPRGESDVCSECGKAFEAHASQRIMAKDELYSSV